jgi:hypothetical protein
MGFARLMSGPVGRGARIVAGLALIAIGASIGGAGWILAVVGLAPLAAGVLNVCLIAPLLGVPFSGAKCRTS